jgi:iron-sulfur cluster assembly accessory protein|tara:strand:+ start:1387 stop:1713 length:327 start_codon:yes stop_codon:yes gene_type:complete
MTNLITITENANQHLTELSKEHNKKYVRLEVKGGGCAGFKYEWSFEDNKDDNDEVLKYENFTLLIDKSSILMLAGMTVEYRKEIFGSFLELKNPNATSTCGCGESFGA